MIDAVRLAHHMTLHSDVPLDGCVVHVVTQQCEDGGHLIMRYLKDNPWRIMEFRRCHPYQGTLTQSHEWGCHPQGCARAVHRYRQSGNKSISTYRDD